MHLKEKDKGPKNFDDLVKGLTAIGVFAGALTYGTLFTLPFPTVPWADRLESIAINLAWAFSLFTCAIFLSMPMSVALGSSEPSLWKTSLTLGLGAMAFCIYIGFSFLGSALMATRIPAAGGVAFGVLVFGLLVSAILLIPWMNYRFKQYDGMHSAVFDAVREAASQTSRDIFESMTSSSDVAQSGGGGNTNIAQPEPAENSAEVPDDGADLRLAIEVATSVVMKVAIDTGPRFSFTKSSRDGKHLSLSKDVFEQAKKSISELGQKEATIALNALCDGWDADRTVNNIIRQMADSIAEAAIRAVISKVCVDAAWTIAGDAGQRRQVAVGQEGESRYRVGLLTRLDRSIKGSKSDEAAYRVSVRRRLRQAGETNVRSRKIWGLLHVLFALGFGILGGWLYGTGNTDIGTIQMGANATQAS